MLWNMYVRNATESAPRKHDNKGKKITKEIPNLPKVTAELRIYSNPSNGRGLSRNQSARAKLKKNFKILNGVTVAYTSSVTVGCTADRNGDIICYVHLVKLRSFTKLYVLPLATVLRKPELCISSEKRDIRKISRFLKIRNFLKVSAELCKSKSILESPRSALSIELFKRRNSSRIPKDIEWSKIADRRNR